MTVETKLDAVYNYIMGDDSILFSIRNGKGLDKEGYKKLVDALKFLIDHYKNSATVPKKLALCFVDISNYFYPDEFIYGDEKEREQIEDAGHEISELANQLFEE